MYFVSTLSLILLVTLAKCDTRNNACFQPKDHGIASVNCEKHLHGSKFRYFYNVDKGKCEEFMYGGCGGNTNNFFTTKECEEQCILTPNTYQFGSNDTSQNQFGSESEKRAKEVCIKPRNNGSMFEGEKPVFVFLKEKLKNPELRFYFNNKHQRCEVFQYYGPHVNENNFGSLRDCFEFCKPLIKLKSIKNQIKSRCLQREHGDACSRMIGRRRLAFKYIFDQESLQCIPKLHSGCTGWYSDKTKCAKNCFHFYGWSTWHRTKESVKDPKCLVKMLSYHNPKHYVRPVRVYTFDSKSLKCKIVFNVRSPKNNYYETRQECQLTCLKQSDPVFDRQAARKSGVEQKTAFVI